MWEQGTPAAPGKLRPQKMDPETPTETPRPRNWDATSKANKATSKAKKAKSKTTSKANEATSKANKATSKANKKTSRAKKQQTWKTSRGRPPL